MRIYFGVNFHPTCMFVASGALPSMLIRELKLLSCVKSSTLQCQE
jgi:hypothetical protein